MPSPAGRPGFQPGDVVEFCDDFYVVKQNHGRSGTVSYLDGQHCSSHWLWSFEGKGCRLATVDELKSLLGDLPLVAAALERLDAKH
jgi:hypothetical protein